MWLIMTVTTLIRYWFSWSWQSSYVTDCIKTQPPQPSIYSVPETWQEDCWRFFSWTEQRALFTATACKLYVIWRLRFFGMWRRITVGLVLDVSRQSTYPYLLIEMSLLHGHFNIWRRGHWFFRNTEYHSPRDATLRHGITEISTTPLQKPVTSTV
jgi:hypothetical protein